MVFLMVMVLPAILLTIFDLSMNIQITKLNNKVGKHHWMLYLSKYLLTFWPLI